MKKLILLSLSISAFFVNGYSQTSPKQGDDTNGPGKKTEVVAPSATKKIASTRTKPDKKTKALRKQHAKFLANSAFKKTMKLSKKERKAYGIPPNKYYEMEWELTMNPALGRPTPENLVSIRRKLAEERRLALASGRTPGDASDNNWVERGPNNVGGRVRALMFDPNDAAYKTVFAGGVSGGLWKNTDITNAATVWTRVNVPENLAVSAISYDPNNTNIFYVGTGESYVGGDVNGDGVWKSTDGGATWTKIFGGITGPTTFEAATKVTINSPAGVAGDYACYPTTAFGSTIVTPITANIVLVNDGTATPTLGCGPLTNAASVNGKIALIRRGNCPFVDKVNSAQAAGAIGVIMMNNIDGTPIPMGGADAGITIPSVMISKADGDILEAALGSGTVNGTLNPSTGSFTGNLVPGQQHINDIKVRNNGGTSEIYVAAGDTYYSSANSATYLGGPGFGLFKSVNGGATWTEVSLPLTTNGNKHCPNDIEIAADGKVWVSTTRSVVFGDGGGKVFSSADGVTFVDKFTVTGNGGGSRVQIEASATNANKLYVLSELEQATATATIEVALFRTTDGFATAPTALPLPPDTDPRSATFGFTGQQAFYNLMIEADPANDQNVYVGGLNLHRSTTGGNSWSQISEWSGGLVHSDQHAMAFRPSATNSAVFGNDGGVYYSGSLSTATTASGISERNNGLNITQFYSLGVAPTGATGGNLVNDYFAAGAQDNGTQYFGGVATGVNPSVETQGGDGAFTMFDQGADQYYISNYVYNCTIIYRKIGGITRVLDNDSNVDSNGAFISPMVLDSNLDILYSDYSTATPLYQIRRYSNIKSGTVSRVNLSNALLTSPPTAFAVSPYTTTSTTLLVGTRLGKLLRLTNANATPVWTDISGPSFVGSISDVEFGASNNEIFVTMHNYNVVSIWYSKDAGITWLNKEGSFPDMPVKAIMSNPLKNVGGFATEVIIGTELGVWFSNNFDSATPTWHQSYNGMSNVKVTDLDRRNDNMVFAATYGRGIFSGLFTGTTLSNEDFASSKGIKMYPNPTNGQLNISINQYSGKVSVQVFDLNGRQVYNQDVNDFNVQSAINMNGLQKGVYVVKVSGENLDYSQKVILE